MALDPVNHKALKGKFKDREDKDIDNDGDSDSSDEYLHKRRQAVSKAINKIKEETELSEDETASLQKKADKTGMPLGILRQVYNRGMAAWKTGHRPGTTPSQWGHARVNSFVTKSPGTWGKADSDLAAKVRSEGYTDGEHDISEQGAGLWANIHAKRKRIEAGSGEKMRAPGSKGAPSADSLKRARGATESVKFKTEARDGDGANIVRDKEFKGKPSKTIPYAKPGEPGHNTHASLFKKDGPKPAWMTKQSKMKEEAYRKPTQAEIDADRKKDEKGKPRPSISAKSVIRKTYGNMMGGLKNEEVEQIDEIQINWNHKTQKYHTIRHPDGSHWGVFDHSSYGTKGHEIRKIKDSDGNALKASDSRKNHSAGYKSGMGSPSDAAKAWAKKHGGTITNHKIKEETEELDEAAMEGNWARVSYDYSEDWWSVEVYKNGKVAAKDHGYFGANETGNPLIKKFTDLVKKAGLKPEGLAVVDEDGKKGVFKGNKFKWGVKEEVEKKPTELPADKKPLRMKLAHFRHHE